MIKSHCAVFAVHLCINQVFSKKFTLFAIYLQNNANKFKKRQKRPKLDEF